MLFTKFSEQDAAQKSLADLNGLLKSHSIAIGEIIKSGGESVDLKDDQVIELRERNDQMTLLGKARDAKLELVNIGLRAAKEADEQAAVVERFPMPAEQKARQDTVANARAGFLGIGDQFVKSEAFTGFSPSRHWSPAVDLDVGGIMSMKYQGVAEQKTLLVSSDAAGLIQPEAMFGGRPLEYLQRRPVIADLIPQGTTASPSLRYVEETVNTNGADFVAEGGTKPESALQFADRTATVRKIATVLPVTDEMFADVPAMRSYVEARLRLFMSLREETSLLSGTGSGTEYYGILNVAGTQAKDTATYGGNALDTLYQAMVAVQVNSFLEPSGVIMNPLNWANIITQKTADGVYIWGSPSAAPGPERVWGLPVVATPVITQGTAVVAAFNSSMQVFRREGVTFSVSDQHNDFFITNKLMLRVEERLAFVVYRPSGICVITNMP